MGPRQLSVREPLKPFAKDAALEFETQANPTRAYTRRHILADSSTDRGVQRVIRVAAFELTGL
jgi:hypothetical protein